MTRRAYAERIASAISRKLNKYTFWCKNHDGTIEVYSPSHGVTVIVSSSGALSARVALDANRQPMLGADEFAAARAVNATLAKALAVAAKINTPESL